jgi:hypothetical protein
MTASPKGGSKVFELLEGGTATAEGRKEKAQCLCDAGVVSFTYRICISSEALRRRVVQREFFPRSSQSE